MFVWGMTPYFTIRVWGSLGDDFDTISQLLGEPRRRQLLCEVEVDTTDEAAWDLTIRGHRGLDLVPQKMLTTNPAMLVS